MSLEFGSPGDFRAPERHISKQKDTVNPIKLETGRRPNSHGIPYIFLLKIEATGFPTFKLLL